MDQAWAWAINREGWDRVAPKFVGAAALPSYGPLAPTEDDLGLLGEVQGKTVLELGCGSGHSLLYLARRGAHALWGVDLSATQLDFATALLAANGVQARLVQSPMEQNPGIPAGEFDLVISIYALGWTTDLDTTLQRVYEYLMPGGVFVFSWENPVYSCLDYDAGQYIVHRRYREETVVKSQWSGVPIVMFYRKVSTFLNALVAAGLRIEQVIEGELNPDTAKEGEDDAQRWYSASKAALMPTTLIVKARKE